MDKKDMLLQEMINHDSGDAWMIQHFIKVSQLARIIGLNEGLSELEMEVLEVAGLVHDIGIKPSREKYGDASGKHQEQEGPSYAKALLEKIGYDQTIVDRVCYLVGNHHTYSDIDGQDYQILVEADFLVNLYENNVDLAAKEKTYQQIFRTESGKELFKNMFGA
ncbi:MAG: HD domain-containing protein [Clostridiales bacterium]|nr:HD domain-containing protein [Clostridiales bacterium]